ncbi:hypothetical protein ACIBI4_15030 [Streptomyces sp. NPDC050418]|uniref:hypothetical protein n=1 Tax=Streptomyces sp. NPDC050418 TaxID=3365612 RepID=UPI0037BD7F9A
MAQNGKLPRWTDWWDETDLAPLFPDPAVRQAITDEQPRLPLSYYEQHIPVPPGWDDPPTCSYLLFSPPYEPLATEAHLHQTVDPAATAAQIVDLTATG